MWYALQATPARALKRIDGLFARPLIGGSASVNRSKASKWWNTETFTSSLGRHHHCFYPLSEQKPALSAHHGVWRPATPYLEKS